MTIAATVAVAGLAVWAAAATIVEPVNQCDNIAGTCLRARQRLAIAAIEISCVVAALSAVVAVVMAVRRPLPRPWVVGLAVIAAFATAVLVVNPAERLNNRWDGWLATSLEREAQLP